MPPQAPQKKSSSHLAPLKIAVAKLCSEIFKGRKISGTIKAPETLTVLRGVLRTQRKTGSSISTYVITDLVTVLDNKGSSLCSRLDTAVFSTIVETILQAQHSRDGERGLYLLAASLYHDSQNPTTDRNLETRNDLIGKESLQPLLSYFVDTGNHAGMRRWVGILSSQLLEGSDENRNKLELGPEHTRRQIGLLVIEESNEIIRVLCAQLVRALVKTGVPLSDLWPSGYNEDLYSKFPPSTQGERGWGRDFSDYIDDVYTKVDEPELEGELHYASGISLKPTHKFGVEDRNATILLVDHEMTILTPSSNTSMEQILDVPIPSIQRMTILQAYSQQEGHADVIIELDNDNKVFCYLDTAGTQLSRIYMTTEVKSVRKMQAWFSDVCPKLNMIDQIRHESLVGGTPETHDEAQRCAQLSTTEKFNLAHEDHRRQSQRTGRTQESIELEPEQSALNQARRTSSNQNHIAEAQHHSVGAKKISPKLDGRKSFDTEQESQLEHGDIYDASSPIERSQKLSAQASTQRNIRNNSPKAKQPNTRVATIKPKAKPPIMMTQTAKKQQHHSASGFSAKVTQLTPDEDKFQSSALAKNPEPPKGVKKAHPKTTALGLKASKELGYFNSENITSPDANDVSTPKDTPVRILDKATTGTTKSTSSTQTAQKKTQNTYYSMAASKKQKRHSLDNLAGKQSNESDNSNVYDFPVDSDDDEAPQVTKKKQGPKIATKAGSKVPASKTLPNTKYGAKTVKAKADKKKRQSAPAVLEKTVPSTRISQRAAATKAKDKMRGADHTDDEIEDEIAKPGVSKNSVTKSMKTLKVDKIQDTAETKSKGKKVRASQHFIPRVEEDGEIVQNQLSDTTSPGLRQDVVNSRFYEDGDFWGANEVSVAPSPTRAQDKLAKAAERGHADDTKKKSQKTTLDIADKLSGMLNFEDGPEQVKTQKLSQGKDLYPAKGSSYKGLAEPLLAKAREYQKDRVDVSENAESQSQDPARLNGFQGEIQGELKPAEVHEHLSPAKLSPAIEFKNAVVPPKQTSHTVQSQAARTPPQEQPFDVDVDDSLIAASAINYALGKPRIGEAAEEISPKHAARKRKAVEDPVPANKRRGTEEARMGDLTGKSNILASDSSLVDDRLVRKPAVIAFDTHGAQNQGTTSEYKSSVNRQTELNMYAEKTVLEAAIADHKRKRQTVELVDESVERIPPKKRQSMSPHQTIDLNNDDDDSLQAMHSSPPKPIARPVPARTRSLKPSSQASRVDVNGSPLASPSVAQVDHIGKIKEKLRQQEVQVEILKSQDVFEEEHNEKRTRRTSEIFGPRVKLGSQPKVGPLSPEHVAARYVPHEKKGNGHYEEVGTKEVIAPQKALADPFVEKGRKLSDFAERLRKGGGGAKHENHNRQPLNPKEVAPPESDPVGIRKQTGRSETVAQASVEDAEKTLVNESHYQRIPNGMTNDTTWDSTQPSRATLKERAAQNDAWNIAIRPHYKTLSHVVHCIADGVIIRLAGEEERMGLLVKQYKQGGSKVLHNLERKREQEQFTTMKQIEQKKTEVFSMYRSTQEFMLETAQELRESPVKVFEMEWRKNQVSIQKQISEGMDKLDN